MRKIYLPWINRRKSRGLVWVTLLFLLEGCNTTPNRERDDEIDDKIKAAKKANDKMQAAWEELKKSLERQERNRQQKDRDQQQDEQATREFLIRQNENLAENSRRLYEQGVLNRRSNTTEPFVTRTEDNRDQLSISSEEEDLLNPEEILNMKRNNPQAVLTPNQSISLLNHCAQLGAQRAAQAANRETCLVLGNTGVGKSAFLNALMGCRMKRVNPVELGLSGRRRVLIVDPESPRGEVMPIGHGGISKTFMPRIAPDPDHPNKAYCDCPGFTDNRGAEINIANAINTRSVLQQATGVKAVFLTSYNGLCNGRGRSVRAMENMCQQLFGSVDNLRRHQNAVLLGITKAPLYNEDNEPLTRDMVRSDLTQSNTPIATILANRLFLFDPMDHGSDNPNFWSLARCRNEIDQLDTIPQQEATSLFQTVLTDSDRTHLLNTIRQLRPSLTQAIAQGDEAALSRYWQLLQRLQVIQHPAIEQLIQGEVLPAINAALQQLGNIEAWTDQYNFDQAEAQLVQLTQLIQQLPGAMLEVDLDALNQRLTHYREQYAERQRMNTEEQRLEAERQRMNTENQELEHELTQLNEEQRRGERELNQLEEQQHELEALNSPEQNAPASHDPSNESP